MIFARTQIGPQSPSLPSCACNSRKNVLTEHILTSEAFSSISLHSHKIKGRPGRGTESRVEGRHFIKLWYEGGIPLWNDKLLCGT